MRPLHGGSCAGADGMNGGINAAALDTAVRRFPVLLKLCRKRPASCWRFFAIHEAASIRAEYQRILKVERPR